MVIRRFLFVLSLVVILTGCSSGPFDEGKVRYLLEFQPHPLDGEQVALNPGQVDCGVTNELWETVTLGPERAVERLTQKARDLKFDDDIQVGELRLPYAQVRGSFTLQMLEVANIRDVDPKTKEVDAKVGVRMNHACFGAPPVLMGVRHGRFTQDAVPRFRFRLESDWVYDGILH
jgi:hypothetical protein